MTPNIEKSTSIQVFYKKLKILKVHTYFRLNGFFHITQQQKNRSFDNDGSSAKNSLQGNSISKGKVKAFTLVLQETCTYSIRSQKSSAQREIFCLK